MSAEPAASNKVEDAAKALLGGNPKDEMPAVELQAVTADAVKEKSEKTAENQQETKRDAPPTAERQQDSRPVPMDEQGRTFDPLLHETEDGITPIFRKDGVTLKCRRVPLKEFKTASKAWIPQDEPAGQATAEAVKPEVEPVDPEKAKRLREAGARTCAGVQLLVMRKALGSHLGEKEEDVQALVACWDDLFEYYGMERVHPIMGLAVVTGMITFDAARHEETRGKLLQFVTWCKVKIAALWIRLRS